MRTFYVIMISAVLFALPAVASVEKNIISQAENYLNQMSTVKGTFVQHSNTGVEEKGDFYISRPGKMRLEYKSPMLVVANGKELIYVDQKLDQESHIPLDSTPAGILLKPSVRFENKDIKVLSTEETADVYEITAVLKDDPGAGQLTLIFTKNPFELTSWRVKDAQGVITTVALQNIQQDIALKSSLFQIQRHKVFGPGGLRDAE